MCKHEKLAKIDKIWRCRECGQLFDEPPKAEIVIIKETPEDAPKKAPVKKTARKGAK